VCNFPLLRVRSEYVSQPVVLQLSDHTFLPQNEAKFYVRKTTANVIVSFVRVMTSPFERGIKIEYFELNASVHNKKFIMRTEFHFLLLFEDILLLFLVTREDTYRFRVFVLSVFCILKKILFSKYTLAEDLLPRRMRESYTSYANPMRNTRSYHTWILYTIQDLIIIVGSYA
jgi:hypothetical protein